MGRYLSHHVDDRSGKLTRAKSGNSRPCTHRERDLPPAAVSLPATDPTFSSALGFATKNLGTAKIWLGDLEGSLQVAQLLSPPPPPAPELAPCTTPPAGSATSFPSGAHRWPLPPQAPPSPLRHSALVHHQRGAVHCTTISSGWPNFSSPGNHRYFFS